MASMRSSVLFFKALISSSFVVELVVRLATCSMSCWLVSVSYQDEVECLINYLVISKYSIHPVQEHLDFINLSKEFFNMHGWIEWLRRSISAFAMNSLGGTGAGPGFTRGGKSTPTI
eukprot:3111064-Ditylum_brightwellii.AAC.2